MRLSRFYPLGIVRLALSIFSNTRGIRAASGIDASRVRTPHRKASPFAAHRQRPAKARAEVDVGAFRADTVT